MIVIGPGSLFSSVLPNLLIRDVRDALAAAPGLKVYVCNVATQPGETEDFTRPEHLRRCSPTIGERPRSTASSSTATTHARRPEGWRAKPVEVDVRAPRGARRS